MASRKEQKEALRAERERKAQEAAASERRKRMIGFAAAGALVAAAVVAIVVVLLSSGGGDDGGGGGERAAGPGGDFPEATIPAARQTNLEAAAKAANCKVEKFPSEGANHVDGEVQYKTQPPTSGDHFEIPAADGAYLEAPRMEELVHELEHGRVILWFKPNASPQLKGQLKALFDEDDYHMVLSPNPREMPSEVAASAWTRSVTCPKATPEAFDALRLFRDRYRDQGPEQVP